FDHAFARQPTIERSNRSEMASDRGLAKSAVVQFGEIAADAQVIDLSGLRVPYVLDEVGEVLGVCKDRIRGGITLVQCAQKLLDGFPKSTSQPDWRRRIVILSAVISHFRFLRQSLAAT